MQTVDGAVATKGFQTLTVSNAAVSLTVPAGARIAVIQCDKSTGDINWRSDGTDPTAGASGGMHLWAGNDFLWASKLTRLRFIRYAGADGTLTVEYYA